MNKIYTLFFLMVLVSSVGCYYDNKEELFQTGQDCELEDVTYAAVVKPIIEDQCYTCHATGTELGNVDLEDFQQLKSYIDDESFLKSIRHDPGVSPMPEGGAKLSDCKIQQIEKWITEGALDN